MDTSNSKSIIYVAPNRASFVMQDIEHLKKHIKVTPYFFEFSSKLFVPIAMIKLFFFLLSKEGTILISFGGYHSYIATLVGRLKKRRTYIILNGTDSVSIPEYSYGHLRKGLLRFCCKKSYKWAFKLLPVSESLMDTTNSYAFEKKRLGLKAGVGQMFDYQTIPNGFDTEFWRKTKSTAPKSVLTVASINRLSLKGVDLLIKLAQQRPDYTFSIAGIDHIDNLPKNVVCLGYLSARDLRDAYSASQYYFQLSVWEGFGCALCEAMLCGSIPVVSDVNILSEIVGDKNYVLNKRSLEQLERLFYSVTNSVVQTDFVKRITDNYPIERRINALLAELEI